MSDSIVIGDEQNGRLLAMLAGTSYNPAVDVNFCRVKDGVRLGGVIFTDYAQESIAIHSAAWDPRWINRDMLYVTFDYPFNQLRVNRIFGYLKEGNDHALTFDKKLGFREVARIPGVYEGGKACIVVCLERDDCRMLGVKPRNIRSNVA